MLPVLVSILNSCQFLIFKFNLYVSLYALSEENF
uniref:Uncharacterized protein n=1 Tax=Rhizophora mucronata TaxID=61149 RepID=A0A2P2PDH0_RHIMU